MFHQKWAASLLELTLARLSAACEESGLGAHLEMFRERVVRPALEHVAPMPIEELASRHELSAKLLSKPEKTWVEGRWKDLTGPDRPL